jgi:hypothetical protein
MVCPDIGAAVRGDTRKKASGQCTAGLDMNTLVGRSVEAAEPTRHCIPRSDSRSNRVRTPFRGRVPAPLTA